MIFNKKLKEENYNLRQGIEKLKESEKYFEELNRKNVLEYEEKNKKANEKISSLSFQYSTDLEYLNKKYRREIKILKAKLTKTTNKLKGYEEVTTIKQTTEGIKIKKVGRPKKEGK